MTRKRALGRGLDALIGAGARSRGRHTSLAAGNAVDDSSISAHDATSSAVTAPAEQLVRLPIMQLQRGEYQPRREFPPEALDELAASIRARGIMQPLVVRPLVSGKPHAPRYEIIAGERRWRAAQLAELDTVPAIVRELDDETALALALIENIQREDLSPIDEAVALRRLMDEFGLTQQQTADAVGKSRAQIANLVRLLSLESDVRERLEKHEIDVGHARALLALKGTRQRKAAKEVATKSLTVRQTEALVRRIAAEKKETANTAAQPSADVAGLEQRLGELLGAAVKIDHKASGKGNVTIRYTSLDELDGILAHIR
ncbi:ParB/RepB/Spo0J family partition protein [Zymobacter palmae]|uniref:Probable chromosome-partitioning protein ParB n=1 Tax=Zymobacter palmae TaxID=33074 RepID=A0A348HB22_9GAMM|nr:ParB/RepB/Spo0J family partition protein [Zymobacter palmae]BBG28824.1 chromosome partitioning protein, ParB family [Zymobacter palmae]